MDETKFFNREISWLGFNQRVLSEALLQTVPTLERVKFLSIVSSNFDEFFMVRVASLRRALKAKKRFSQESQESPSQTLQKIDQLYRQILKQQYALWDQLQLLLKHSGIHYQTAGNLTQEQRTFVKNLYQKELFNVLSPIKVEDEKTFPFTGNLRLNLAFLISPTKKVPRETQENNEERKMIVVEIPPYLSRFVWLPEKKGKLSFILIEEVIALFANQLVPGYTIVEQGSFRITRDADIAVDEKKDEDFVEAMMKILQNRMHSSAVRLEISSSLELKQRLTKALDIEQDAVYEIPGVLNLKDLINLSNVSGFDQLKYPVWESRHSLSENENIWEFIRQKDRLLFHPYESFSPLVRLLSEAAIDPDVLSIRMTLYRTSGDSPIVQALVKAAMEGKQVTVLVELKARFDEEQNMGWAQTLEDVGSIVIYGVSGLKVHAKALLIIRRENTGIRRYVHLGTGNYNDKTARLYTDLGLLTARDDFTHEVTQFFNAITGYSSITKMKYLAMAPHGLKFRLLGLIQGLTARAKNGMRCQLLAKMNSLADEEVILALYEASQAGVTIKLNIRGICQLIPGKSFSKNIEVVSIIDHYLEHGRIFLFKSDESEEVFLSSADWMYRNLERRVELMFPILQQDLKERISEILKTIFEDNVKSHVLDSKGVYHRKNFGLTTNKVKPIRAQEVFHNQTVAQIELDRTTAKREFVTLKKKNPQ